MVLTPGEAVSVDPTSDRKSLMNTRFVVDLCRQKTRDCTSWPCFPPGPLPIEGLQSAHTRAG